MNRQVLNLAKLYGTFERAARARRETMFHVAITIVALLIFGATFRSGIERGMDQLISWADYGRVLYSVTTAMTEERLGIGGYALNECIFAEFEKRGFTGDPEAAKRVGVTVPLNFRAPFFDKMLADVEAASAKLPDYCRRAIRGIGGDDLGYVDFVKIAFLLFGQHVRAFYYLFFLIYGLTIFCALIERQSDHTGQLVIVAVAVLVYISCYYSDFLLAPEPDGLGNMLSPRFMPVLALVPGTHLLLVLVDQAPPKSWWQLAIVIFQSVVVFFAIHIRAPAAWWVAACLLAALVMGVLALKAARSKGKMGTQATCQAIAAQWPVLTALLVVLVGTNAVALSLHPEYRRGGWLQHHTMWHSIYASLQLHPQYIEKYDAYHAGQRGDPMPVAAAMAYLREHPEEDRPDIYIAGKSLKYAEMERLVRLAFFEFVRRDPWFVFETFFVIKPKLIVDSIATETKVEWETVPGELALFSSLRSCSWAVLSHVGPLRCGASRDSR